MTKSRVASSKVVCALTLCVVAASVFAPGGMAGAHPRGDAGLPVCRVGGVALGAGSGVIRFAASCVGKKTGSRIGLTLLREPARKSQKGLGLLEYSRRPLVSGPGRRGTHGRCELEIDGLDCHAAATGRIRIRGRILVAPHTECERRIVLKWIRPAVCNRRGECLANESFRVLASGRPRGC